MKRRQFLVIVTYCAVLSTSGCSTSTPREQLYAAAREGNSNLIRQVLDENPELKVSPGTLNEAAANGAIECIKLLVERGADVNAQESMNVVSPAKRRVSVSDEGRYSLYDEFHTLSNATMPAIGHAIMHHRVAVVKFLLEHGANPSAKYYQRESRIGANDARWVTIRELAQRSRDAEIIALLANAN